MDERGNDSMAGEEKKTGSDDPAVADVTFMRQAIRLAQTARDRGDAPVGSVVVRDGRVVGEGIESVRAERDPAGHAEVKAVRQACRNLNSLDLSGCTLFTTAEPCFMCSYVIRSARISRVVIGRAALHVGGLTSKYPVLSAPDIPCWREPPLVLSGLLEEECGA